MEKRKLDLKPIKNIKFDFMENEIEMRPQLTVAEQIMLINNYVECYFNPDPDSTNVDMAQYDFLGAEMTLIAGIVDMLTSIIILEDGQRAIDVNDLFGRGLWDEVRKRIINYESFRSSLDRVVNDIKEQKSLEKSIGSVIDNVYGDIVTFLREAGSMSEEKVNAVKQSLIDLQKQVEDSPLSGLMAEAGKKPRARKKKV